MRDNPIILFIDLFCGAGGVTTGAVRAGTKTYQKKNHRQQRSAAGSQSHVRSPRNQTKRRNTPGSMMEFKSIDETSSAILSDCGQYRYSLTRQWGPVDPGGRPYILWIMLNPSTADHLVNDPTIRRCISFSKEWGYNKLIVANLFALRATDPQKLKEHKDPIGPENNKTIFNHMGYSRNIVFAWGNHGTYLDRSGEVNRMTRHLKVTPQCLGVTKQGQPRHPLYLKQNQKLEEYKPETLDFKA